MKTKLTNKLLAVVTVLVMLLTMTSLALTADAAEYDAANATRKPVTGTVTLAGLPPQSIELPPLGHVFIDIAIEK